MVKISYILVTARRDFPYSGRPDLHLFEPTLTSMKSQTMKDFEIIIVDVLYHIRKDYFKNLDLPFKVKHVPATPNLWIENGFMGICNQLNKGIIYADGELLFFTGDGFMFKADFMKNLWERYTQGYFPLAWYLYDFTYAPSKTEPKVSSPTPYNIAGYEGKDVSIEHRYDIAFKNNREMFSAPWNWFFGCSSASLEAMLTINGYDLKFEGDRMLLDCDVGSRLELAGYGQYLALFKDIFLVRAPTDSGTWSLSKGNTSIKCQYPLIYFNRAFNLPKANTYTIGEKEIKWIKEEFCENQCNIRNLCKKDHQWQFPFEHKERPNNFCKKEYFEFWKSHQTTIDLREERQKRLDGDAKYQIGTFISQ